MLTDAYVFASTSKYTRLYALVVGSPNSEELKRFLAQNIDDVFVPRIIRHVAQLPRNTNGKIIHSEVLTLWNSLSAEKLIAPVSKAPKPNLQSTRTVQIPLTHAVFEAYFPGQPLVPAALLLMWIEQWLMEEHLKITTVKTCKFLHPVLPGDTLALVYHQPHANRLTLKLMKADLIVLEGQFSLEGCYVE